MERFDQLLADDEIKNEFERRMGDAKREWERLASLSSEERLSERESALEKREQALKMSELRAGARESFIKRRLPAEFASVFAFADGDTERGVDMVEAAFRNAVQAEVLSRLGGSVPKVAASVRPAADMSDEEYYSSISV